MKTRKRVMALLFAVVIFAGIFSGCSSSENEGANQSEAETTDETANEEKASDTWLVGYSNLSDADEFNVQTKNFFMAADEQDDRFEAIYADAANDVAKQIEQVENFITQGVDAIILLPVDYDGAVPAVEAANSAGIPVICVGIEANCDGFVYAGTSHKEAGMQQGEYACEYLPENAQIVYMSGTPGMYHSTQRWEGFKETCLDKRDDITVLAEQTGNYLRDEAMVVMEDWLQAYDHIDGVVCANDAMALGAIEAVKAAGRMDEISFISGVDATEDACNAIKNNEMTHSAFQSAQKNVDACIELLGALMDGTPVDELEDIIVPYEAVTIENVEEYLALY